MIGFLLGVGAISLLLAGGAMAAAVVALSSGSLELSIPGGTPLASTAVQVILGLWAATCVGAAGVFARLARQHLAVRRALRKPGPKGMILITADTIREMAGVLLREELGVHKFRVQLRPMGEGLALQVLLRLPPGEELPALAERLQNLLAQEISAKTGLAVPEVRMIVEGTARPGGR
ncbi:MAG: hypothetical protein N2320_03545 [Candidatus Bipolaricaulota bacterium]|nr:hypothetical protein [Candidatus Bipolaricaulota bacterium]